MRNVFAYLLSMLAFLSVSCDVEMYEEECYYSVTLSYDYNEENTSYENKILFWVDHIDEYIFDEQDVLYNVRTVTESMCVDNLDSELALLPGRYSVIAIGNIDGRSVVWDDASGGTPQMGVTRREDMRMTMRNVESFADGTSGPCEELFYGYRTFSVEELNPGEVRVDMINAHLQIRFRVTWKNQAELPRIGNYRAILEEIPSEYKLMPEWIYLPRNPVAQLHDPFTQDLYLPRDNNVIHHIPFTAVEGQNVLDYGYSTYLNANHEVWGQIVGYRLKTDMRLILKLYYTGDDKTFSADAPMVFPKQIDLKQYFDWFLFDLDHELKQEYVIDIVIDGDSVAIAPLEGLNVADWDDGGYL